MTDGSGTSPQIIPPSGDPASLGGVSPDSPPPVAHAPLSDADYRRACTVMREQIVRHCEESPRPLDLRADEQLLVGLDVDGTILTSDATISARVRSSLHAMRETGAQLVIATGRGIHAAMPVVRALGLTHGWMVVANGAVILRLDPSLPQGYEVVREHTFDPAPAIDALMEALPQGIVAVEDTTHGMRVTRPFPEGELIEDVRVDSLENLRSGPVTRVVMRAPGMDLEEFSRIIAGTGLSSVEYAIGWTAWLDVAPPGITKAGGLAELAQILGTDAAHAVTVGDGANDNDMLRWAGLGVAMGNATASVQAHADCVAPPVWHDGLAVLLDSLRELGVTGAAEH